jgi:4-hydroxy-3-methylbut-2-enyl diphosphate reductase
MPTAASGAGNGWNVARRGWTGHELPIASETQLDARIVAMSATDPQPHAPATGTGTLEVVVAASAGFCFGVEAAIEMAEREKKPILGPLVHNPQVVESLAASGIPIYERYVDLDQIGNEREVVITAHGYPKQLKSALAERGIRYHDATCPVLLRWVYRKIERFEAQGYRVLLVGNPDHAEIIASASHGTDIQVAYDSAAIDAIEDDGRPMVAICQTTITREEFESVVDYARRTRFPELKAVDTRCKPVKNQQEAVLNLAQWVDAMIVIGGYDSSNTTKLVKIARQYLPRTTYHVDSPEKIEAAWLSGLSSIGIGAGTSTPKEAISGAKRRIADLYPGEVIFHREEKDGSVIEDPDVDDLL